MALSHHSRFPATERHHRHRLPAMALSHHSRLPAMELSHRNRLPAMDLRHRSRFPAMELDRRNRNLVAVIRAHPNRFHPIISSNLLSRLSRRQLSHSRPVLPAKMSLPTASRKIMRLSRLRAAA
jgi:hypothetical protein